MTQISEDGKRDDGSLLNRRSALKSAGVLFGGMQLFSTAAASHTTSKKKNIKLIDGEERAAILENVFDSQRFSKIRQKFEELGLSTPKDSARAYKISTNSTEYIVASLFPTYQNQGQRALGTNIAVLLNNGAVEGINAVLSEYIGTAPKRIRNFVISGDSVETFSTRLNLSKQSRLIMNAERMSESRGPAESQLKRLNSLKVTPGVAVLPFLNELSNNSSQYSLTVASSVALFSARSQSEGLDI